MKADEFLNRKKLKSWSIARHQWSEKGSGLKNLGCFRTGPLGGLVWVSLMSLMGTFPESAPPWGVQSGLFHQTSYRLCVTRSIGVLQIETAYKHRLGTELSQIRFCVLYPCFLLLT